MSKETKQKDVCSVRRKTSIGGQALIEGIMMRGPKRTAMAVRDTSGKIVFEEWKNPDNKRPKITKLPIIRGVFGFIDSMATGYKSLMRSAELSGLEEAEAELQREKEAKKAAKAKKKAEKLAKKNGDTSAEADAQNEAEVPAETASSEEPRVAEEPIEEPAAAEQQTETADETKGKKEKKKESSALVTGIMLLAVVIAVVLAVGIFFFLPTVLYDHVLLNLVPALRFEGNEFLSSLCRSTFCGIIKLVVIVLYMLGVSLMKDIRRTFRYHGAEHKTIFCYEHGKALTVENVRKERRFHPRCGTSFLVLMMLVSIAVFLLVDVVAILITGHELGTGLYTLCKILFLPLVMGIGYEVLKFAGRHENWFTRLLSAPGMWMQHITVLEPDDDMIECAIMAFKAVIPDEEIPEEEAKIAAETGNAAMESGETVEAAPETDCAEPAEEDAGSTSASEAENVTLEGNE